MNNGSLRNNLLQYGSLKVSRKLIAKRIDSDLDGDKIVIGGCADDVIIQGDLEVTGNNCANCLQTNDSNIDVNISNSNPPTAGQVLVATSNSTAEWQPMSGGGMGDVSGPASSTNNEIVRFDGITGSLIKSDATDPTTIDDNGHFSGPDIETSTDSTVLGNNTGKGSNESVHLGANTGNNISSGGFNTFVGHSAGLNCTTGGDNVLIGRESGVSLTTGNLNVIVGSNTGTGMNTQSGCVILGYNVGQNNTQDNRLMIDNTFTNTPLLDGDFAGDVLTVNGDLVVTGENEADRLRTTGAPVEVGSSAPPSVGQALVATSATSAEWDDVVRSVGGSTVNEIAVFDDATGNVIRSNLFITIDSSGSIVGPTIYTDQSPMGSVGLGANTSAGTTNQNVLIGTSAGFNLTSSSDNNTFLGYESGLSGFNIQESVYIGSRAGRNSTSTNTIFIGSGTGESATGNDNLVIGNRSYTQPTSGTSNTIIGNEAGDDIQGNNNVVIGKFAGFPVLDNNVIIGTEASSMSNPNTGCVIIGYQAGQNNNFDDRLMIHNSNTNTPLLDGDFANNTLTINGDLTVTGTNEADRLRTTGAPVEVGTSAPPTAGQALVATSPTSAVWDDIISNITGSSLNNQIVVYNGTSGNEIKSTSQTNIDASGRFLGLTIKTDNSNTGLGDGLSINFLNGNDDNTFIGTNVGFGLTSGVQNTLLGSNAGNQLIAGSSNVCVGFRAGEFIGVGGQNVYIGDSAGTLSGGNFNVAIGTNAGGSTVVAPLNNTNNNVMIGQNSGDRNTGNNCVFFGSGAGTLNGTDNRLLIHNQDTNVNTPLIDGNFLAYTLTLNGQVTIGDSGNPAVTHNLFSNTSGTASAGGASLPASPQGFIIINLNGTDVKIPYYPV